MKKMTNKMFLIMTVIAFIVGCVPVIDTVSFLWTWFMYIKPGLPAGSVPPIGILHTTTTMAVCVMLYFIGLIGYFTTNK